MPLLAETRSRAVAGLVEHPAGGGRLGVLDLPRRDLLVEVGGEERERGAVSDPLAHPPERFDVAELRRPAEPVLASDPLAVEAHRLGDQRRRRAERGERRPVARDLERRGEPRVPGVGDVGRADKPGVVREQHGEPRPGDHGLAGRGEVQA